MSDGALDTITKLIQSPPGQLAAGGVLAGIVWKFFERVEAVLKENTKLEIAAWLLGVRLGQKVEPWPDTFARVFDRVFGTKALSWKCFRNSSLFSVSISALALSLTIMDPNFRRKTADTLFYFWPVLIGSIVVGNILPDYFSLLLTRHGIGRIPRNQVGGLLLWTLIQCSFTGWLAILASILTLWLGNAYTDLFYLKRLFLNGSWVLDPDQDPSLVFDWMKAWATVATRLWVLPAFSTSIWLWLYAGSGFILKAARRFDIGFYWFNRKFDIEKKPLQSIGLVAGALVAIVYWTAVIVTRALG